MENIIDTRIQNFRENNPKFDSWEYKVPKAGGLAAVLDETNNGNLLTPEFRAAVQAKIGTVTEIPVINYKSATIQSSLLKLAIVDDPLTSAMVPVVTADYYFGFQIHEGNFLNNEIGKQRYFDTQIKRFVNALMAKLDTDTIAAFELAKTKVVSDLLGGEYTFVADTLVSSAENGENVLGAIDSILMGDDLGEDVIIVGNAAFRNLISQKVGEKGLYNTENKTWQLNGKEFYFTNKIANEADARATFFVVQRDSWSYLMQYQADCILGSQDPDSYMTGDGKRWDIIDVPGLGMKMGYFGYSGAENATGGDENLSTQSVAKVESHSFHVRLAIVPAHVSDPATMAAPTMKVKVLKA